MLLVLGAPLLNEDLLDTLVGQIGVGSDVARRFAGAVGGNDRRAEPSVGLPQFAGLGPDPS